MDAERGGVCAEKGLESTEYSAREMEKKGLESSEYSAREMEKDFNTLFEDDMLMPFLYKCDGDIGKSNNNPSQSVISYNTKKCPCC